MTDNFKWKESMFMMMRDNPTEEINTKYVADIKEYFNNPSAPCGRKESLKLLKRFSRKEFSEFWTNSITEYLPAVSEGTMKLAETVHSHNDAVIYAKNLISTINPKDPAKAFLYGISHNAPEYRTALACYYFIKNLPEHDFERKYLGTIDKDIYSDNICEVCKYNSKLSDEPKMQFWHINTEMAFFYFKALVPFSFNLNTAITFLEEYKTLPEPDSTINDLNFFNKIIALIEALPENISPSKLRKELKQSGLLKMTIEQIDAFIDMLGYLNILHTNKSFGVTVGHTNERDMVRSQNTRSYYAYPVDIWTRKHGIDYNMIDHLFDNIY